MVSQETLVTQRKHNWRHCLHEIKSCKACIFNTQINKFYAPVGLKIRDRLNSVQVQSITRRRHAILCHFQRKGSIATLIGDLQVVIFSKRNKTQVPFQLNEFSNRLPSRWRRTRHPQKMDLKLPKKSLPPLFFEQGFRIGRKIIVLFFNHYKIYYVL